MKLLAIAQNTFREAVRDKIFMLVVAFGLVMVASSVVMSPLTVGARQKIVADMGLASLSVFALIVVLLVGSNMVHKEMDKRTIMTILSKPISRFEYMAGKYLGLVATLSVMMLGMLMLFWLACLATGTEFRAAFVVSAAASLVEMAVVTAIVMFFSSFSTPVLTSLLTLGCFVVGHMINDLESFAAVTESAALLTTVQAMKYVLPNLDLFNLRAEAVHELPITTSQIGLAFGYGVLYSAVLLALSDLLFRRREFK